MTSTTLNHLHNLPRNEGSVMDALGEVAVAFKHLAVALFTRAPAAAAAQLSAFEEAEQLRSYALEIQSQDPDFALDLFAAADRHEAEAAAQAGTPALADDYSLPELRQIIAKPVSAVSATA